jgi:hypothetical protein
MIRSTHRRHQRAVPASLFRRCYAFEAYHQFLGDLIGGRQVDNVSFNRVYNPEAQPERQFEEWLRCHHRAQALAAG